MRVFYTHGVFVASFPFAFILISAALVIYLSYPVNLEDVTVIERLSLPLSPTTSVLYHNKMYILSDILLYPNNIHIPYISPQPSYPVFIRREHLQIWDAILAFQNFTRGQGQTLYYSNESTSLSAEFYILTTSYALVFIYISLVMSKVDLVKSKFGLGFSAMVMIFSSLFMSVGLWDKLGFDSMLVPWEVLPFLVIALGVENVLVLTNAVVSTSMDLPVKERVGLGFAEVSGRMLWTLACEMGTLVLGSLIGIRALQEFCMFGAVSIVMDYFLQITFFLPVLSIDIRRLELSELHKLNRKPAVKRRSSWTAFHEKACSTTIIVIIIIMVVLSINALWQQQALPTSFDQSHHQIPSNSTATFWTFVSTHSITIRPPIYINTVRPGTLIPNISESMFSIHSLHPTSSLLLVVISLICATCTYVFSTSFLHHLSRSKGHWVVASEKDQDFVHHLKWKESDVFVSSIPGGWRDVENVFVNENVIAWDFGVFNIGTKNCHKISGKIGSLVDDGVACFESNHTTLTNNLRTKSFLVTGKFMTQLKSGCVIVADGIVQIVPPPSSLSSERVWRMHPPRQYSPLIPSFLTCDVDDRFTRIFVGGGDGVYNWTLESNFDSSDIKFNHFPTQSRVSFINYIQKCAVIVVGCECGGIYLWDVDSGIFMMQFPQRHLGAVTHVHVYCVAEAHRQAQEACFLFASSGLDERVCFWQVLMYKANGLNSPTPSTPLTPTSVRRLAFDFARPNWTCARLSLLHEFWQSGCVCIAGRANCVLGLRRVFLGVEWTWEVWIVDLQDYRDGLRVCRTIGVGEDILHSGKIEKATRRSTYTWANIFGKGDGAINGVLDVPCSMSTKTLDRFCARTSTVCPDFLDVSGGWISIVEDWSENWSDDDSAWDTDNEKGETEEELPVLQVWTVAAADWGIAFGFSNCVKYLYFQ